MNFAANYTMNSDTLQVIIYAATGPTALVPAPAPAKTYLSCILVSHEWHTAALAAFVNAELALGRPINVLVRELVGGYQWTLSQRMDLAPLVCMQQANLTTVKWLASIHDFTATPKLLAAASADPQLVLEYFRYHPAIVAVMTDKPVSAPAAAIATACAYYQTSNWPRIRTIKPFTDKMMAKYPEEARRALTMCNDSYEIVPSSRVWSELIGAGDYDHVMNVLLDHGRDVKLLLEARPVVNRQEHVYIGQTFTDYFQPETSEQSYREYITRTGNSFSFDGDYGRNRRVYSRDWNINITDLLALLKDMWNTEMTRGEVFDRVMKLRVERWW